MGHPVHIVPPPVNRGSCFMLPRRQHCPEKSIIYLWRYATLFRSNMHNFFPGYAFSFRYDTLFLSDIHTFSASSWEKHLSLKICHTLSFKHTYLFSAYAFSFRYVTPFLSDKHTFFPEKSIIYLLRYAALFLLNIYTYFFQDMLFVSDMSHFFFQINLLFSALSWEKHHLSFKICRTFSSEYTWWSLYNQSLLKLSENNNVGCKVTAEN